jgi:hypothetical protein
MQDRSSSWNALVLSFLGHLVLVGFLVAFIHVVQRRDGYSGRNPAEFTLDVALDVVEPKLEPASVLEKPVEKIVTVAIPKAPIIQQSASVSGQGKAVQSSGLPSSGGSTKPANVISKPLHPPLRSGKSVVYVLDASGSMALQHRWKNAIASLEASLRLLEESMQFQVVTYRIHAEQMLANESMLFATPENIEKVLLRLQQIEPSGGSAHLEGLQTALRMKPDVIFLLSDGVDLTNDQLRLITKMNQRSTAIHPMLLSPVDRLTRDSSLHRLAEANRGKVGSVPRLESLPANPRPVPR